MELVRHKMLYGCDDCGCVFAALSITGMTTARKPPNKTRAFSEFHLEAGKVGRTSLEDSDFDIMEAVLSVVVLHMLDGVGESASVPAVAFSCPGRLLAGLPRRLYAGWEGSASFTINQ